MAQGINCSVTSDQSLQLGKALTAWGHGAALEARNAKGPDKSWYPFTPEDYEKLNVEKGIEWRVSVCAPAMKSS